MYICQQQINFDRLLAFFIIVRGTIFPIPLILGNDTYSSSCGSSLAKRSQEVDNEFSYKGLQKWLLENLGIEAQYYAMYSFKMLDQLQARLINSYLSSPQVIDSLTGYSFILNTLSVINTI
jgi:hypothetical protein